MSTAEGIFAPLLLACSGEPAQSMVHPAGPAAAEIAQLWWVMLVAFTAVFVLVMILLLYAILRKSTTNASSALPPWGRTGFIVAGGILLPVLVLTPLYVYSLKASAGLRLPGESLTIRVVGHMWWWEVRYPDSQIVTANEIHIPVGKPIRLEL